MRVFNSFIELGAAFGVQPKHRKQKPFVCRKCGGVMRNIPGTNVMLCENKTSEGKDCGNRVFTKFIPA